MKTLLLSLLFATPLLTNAQNMDEKIKALAIEVADQVVKNGGKKVAVTALDYRNCTTEFGKFLAEELTGNLSVSGRPITIVNQRLLESLLTQNQLTAKGLLEARNDAAKLGQVSGIDALVYGTITVFGDEVRVSVSVVKLPTLTVFGYAKSAFPLTGGIKEMLPCLIDNTDLSALKNPTSPGKTSCRGNNSAGVLITVKECVMSSRQVECSLLITNEREDKADASFRYAPSNSYIITDSGRQYAAGYISIGNSAMDYGMSIGYTAIYGVKVTGKILFSVENSSVKSLQVFEMKDQGLRCTNVPVISTNK